MCATKEVNLNTENLQDYYRNLNFDDFRFGWYAYQRIEDPLAELGVLHAQQANHTSY